MEGGQMQVSRGNKGNKQSWKKLQGGEALAKNQLRTRQDVRGPLGEFNVPRGVRQVLGSWSALQMLETGSLMKSDTR